MRGLIKSIKIEELNHNIINDCEEVSPVGEFNLVAVLN
jgi:hypothetical protein